MSGWMTRLYLKYGSNSFLFTLACLVWIIWRVSTKPARIGYPCQRLAISQVVLFFGPTVAPLLGVCYRVALDIRRIGFLKLAGISAAFVILVGGAGIHNFLEENQLKARGSGTITLSLPAMVMGAGGGEPMAAGVGDDPLVSLSYDPSLDYGTVSPYDAVDNPAYDFVWETVEKLRLGTSSNPLDGLIDAGDTVLIKPNLVDFGPAVYTRPQVVRPLIDMAIAAGATEIYIGDGGENVPLTDGVLSDAGYSAMVGTLALRHPGITIATVNLNALSNGWHWISLGSDSSFAGSGYTHYDLSSGSETLYQHTYYETADPQGVNPNGDTLGWYAVSDRILGTDVIINVPKMKTHQIMMATVSIKNLVGGTLSSTYNEATGDPQPRIAHCRTEREENYFNNDIFWRAIMDMNKIALYTDADGVLQPAPQRKYLNVIDGIQAMEKSQHHVYGGGGIPYDRGVVVASLDPVAADAVACRLMGYDAAVIPSIGNADSDTVHPIGTNNPENIVVVGGEIDARFCHVFEFNDAWDDYAGSLAITDFTPPAINSVDREGGAVTADISGGLAAYVFYVVDGTEYYLKMSKAGDTYTATVPVEAAEYWVIAQDGYYNTANSAVGPYTWTSYSDEAHSIACDDFASYSSQHTVYMYGTNLTPGHGYRVVYYDGSDNKVDTDDQSSDESGNLSSQRTFKETVPADQPKTWHVIVCEASYSAPSTYDSGWPCLQVGDTFNVQQSAITEFPSVMAAIITLALSAAIYLLLRRKYARSRPVAG